MATQRKARVSNSPTRYGRGRAPADVADGAKRVGLKDKNASRDQVMSIRLTGAQEAAVRDAFERDGAGKTFGVFAAQMLMDGLNATQGVAMIMPQPGARIDGLEEKMAMLAGHQAGLGEKIDQLAGGLAAVLERLEGLGEHMAASLRAVEESARRKPAGKGPDQFTEKVR